MNVHKLMEEEMRRIVAVCRLILPKVSIRLAVGRDLMPDKGESGFTSGANAAISGDMLTTAGIMTKQIWRCGKRRDMR